MLKKANGDISYFSTFDVLHKWMMEQKAVKEDEISRSGEKWVTLESIAEFSPVFQVLDSIKDLLPKSPVQDPIGVSPSLLDTQRPQKQKASRSRVRTEQQYVNFAEVDRLKAERESRAYDRDIETDSDDFIFGNAPPEKAPGLGAEKKEQTAAVRFPRAEPSGSLELPWEMSQEIAIESISPPKKKSGFLRPFFLVVFLGCFAGGIWYLLNMKREKKVISLGGDTPTMTIQNLNKAKKIVSSALEGASAEKSHAEEKRIESGISELRNHVSLAIKSGAEKAKKKASVVSIESMMERGLKALESGNLSLARGSFIHVLDAQPRNSEAITGLGWVKLESGKASSAAKQFKRALQINPSYGQAYMGLGQALRESGKLKPALAAYSRYLKKFPNGSRASIARYQKTELMRKLGLTKSNESSSN